MRDVVIVGAGPSGLYAGWLLSKRGFRVLVTEEHGVAGQPIHCTGIVAVDTFNEFALPESAVLNELRKVRFHSPAGQRLDYVTDRVEALVVDRYVFDQSLLRWALQAGVEMRLNSKVTGVSLAGSYVDVRCAGRADPIRARACILANGANYGLQAEMGLGMPPIRLNSAQVELPAASPGDVEIFFGNSVAPQGFAWIAPVVRPSGYYARIGLMCEGNGALYFEKLLDRVAGRWGLDIRLPITPHLKLLPLSPIRKTYGDRFLVIGDAAGLVKPTTGGGLYYSILSASIASDVLAEALLRDDLGEAALRKYETRWRGRLQEELEAQLTLRLLAQRLTDADIEQLFQLASTDGLIPLIRQTIQFNEHRDLVAAFLKYPATRKILFRKLLR